jgi:hypothetical protein
MRPGARAPGARGAGFGAGLAAGLMSAACGAAYAAGLLCRVAATRRPGARRPPAGAVGLLGHLLLGRLLGGPLAARSAVRAGAALGRALRPPPVPRRP